MNNLLTLTSSVQSTRGRSTMRALLLTVLCVLIAMVAAVNPLAAQTSKGILVGIVRDQTGSVVTGAQVTVTGQQTGETRTVATGDNGAYRIDAINPGTYTLRVEKTGFNTFNSKDLNVTPSQVTTYDAALTVGDVAQTVTVEADSNAINTENAQLSGVVSTVELGKVPIFSLNPVELVSTLPGVQVVDTYLSANSPSPGIYGNGVSIEVNGARPRSNSFLLDGQDINDAGIAGQAFQPIIPDIYQSVTAITNNAAAEYGRGSGAVVNLITKGGTNQFHGTVFDLYTGSGLDALDGLTRKSKPFPSGVNPKARFNTHDIGFTLGGPIIKDRLFAFGASQFHRIYGKQQPVLFEYPDAAGFATLQAFGGPLSTTLTNDYLNNGSYLTKYTAVPNPAGSGPVEIIPITDQNGKVQNVTTGLFQRPSIAFNNPQTQWMYRVDFTPRQQDTFTVRYLHDRLVNSPTLALNTSGLPGFDGEQNGPSELGEGIWTHVLSPNLLNEFRAGETRISFAFDFTAQTKANPAAKLPNITFNDNNLPIFGVYQNIPQGRAQNLYQFQDTVSWTHGKHTLRIGADVGREIDRDLVAQTALGSLVYNGDSGDSGIAGDPVLTGTGLDNYLHDRLGNSGFATITFGPTRIDPHSWKSAYFAQDDFKASPELTLNLGLRYDYLSSPENSLRFPATDAKNIFGPISNVVKVKPDKNNFAPRFGFAYNPHFGFFHDGDTVFHGGIGIFYDTEFSNIAVNGAQSSPNAPTGFLQSSNEGGLHNASKLLSTISPILDPTSSVGNTLNNLVNPLTYQWNFGFERSLPAQIRLAINYVGSRGEKLYTNQQFNYRVNGVRIDPTRGPINLRTNGADSQYHSVQTDVSRQFRNGLFIRGIYTFGKDLDDSSEVFQTVSAPTSYQANLSPNGGHSQDWGPSVFDHRHYFSVTYVYSPKGFHASARAADLLLSAFTRNFSLSGITQLQSGTYSTFNLTGLDTNADGSAVNDRPLIGNSKAPLNTVGFDGSYSGHARGTYYNGRSPNSTPVDPTQVHFLVPRGNQFLPFEIGRNSFENPGLAYWNVAVEKDIPTSFFHLDRGAFVFRVEAQNIGNHNNVSILNTNLLQNTQSAFLDKSSARQGDSRNLRLWAKFTF